MNSQLKKRPGSRFVREIPRDTRDGVALVQLVEVLGKLSSSHVYERMLKLLMFLHNIFNEKCGFNLMKCHLNNLLA